MADIEARPTDERSDAVERAASSVPGLPDDWPLQATNRIVGTVDQVKLKTSGPAIGIARTAVYGIIAGILGIMALILLLILVVRGLNELFGDEVWITYFALGGLFSIAGAVCWWKRPRKAAG
ncbi:MAG: hypothetical protein OEU32_02650 [Acidimicrobiia bacterium]|nr:hypothetical protein [Acidimicrobiia bacterium]